MRRYGRILILKPGMEARYKAYHRRVWPGVIKAARKAGIRNYSIYRYRRWLFAYFELPATITLEHVGRALENQPVCRRWEKIMHRLQAKLPESGAGNWWVPMEEVFHA